MSIGIRVDFENNPNGVFNAGQVICGTVRILTMEEEREVRGVRISIFGKAFCTWRIGTGDDETTYSGEKNIHK